MGVYSLSNKSKVDLANIYEYGIEKFGLNQSQKYLMGLHDLFQILSSNLNMGRDASEFAPMLKRFSYQSHMIFYLVTADESILVIRILSQSMNYDNHL
ncbi:MAG: type II toxin-antitoxin system RelE/ParE family toxin [Cyclobacteriaceae bacterium]